MIFEFSPKSLILWIFDIFKNKNGQNGDFLGLKLLKNHQTFQNYSLSLSAANWPSCSTVSWWRSLTLFATWKELRTRVLLCNRFYKPTWEFLNTYAIIFFKKNYFSEYTAWKISKFGNIYHFIQIQILWLGKIIS